jgi:hypothetical protein
LGTRGPSSSSKAGGPFLNAFFTVRNTAGPQPQYQHGSTKQNSPPKKIVIGNLSGGM